jgi:hypothetical protein
MTEQTNKPKRKPPSGAKLKRPVDPNPINPNYFYRLADGPRFFGYASTVLAEKIKNGDVPLPVTLSEGGRARGWFGWQILDWQKEQVDKAAEREARACEERQRKKREREGKPPAKRRVATRENPDAGFART